MLPRTSTRLRALATAAAVAALALALAPAVVRADRVTLPFQYAWRFHYGDDPSSPPQSGPGTAVFEDDLSNYTVCEGMEHAPNRFSLKDCRLACAYDPNCLVWQVRWRSEEPRNVGEHTASRATPCCVAALPLRCHPFLTPPPLHHGPSGVVVCVLDA